MENIEKIFIFTSTIRTHASVRAFISFVQEHIDVKTAYAPYFYRAIFVPLSAHIGTRFGIYGLLIPSLMDNHIEDKMELIKETDIVGAMINLITDSTKEIVNSLPEIWDIPSSFDKVKGEIEEISKRIFKERHVTWIDKNTWEAMNILTLAIHYENLMVSLFYQMGDILLSIEKNLGYLSMYKRIVAETMISYAMAPAFKQELSFLPQRVINAILPMIEDVIQHEDAKTLYTEKSPLISYTYGISRDILEK